MHSQVSTVVSVVEQEVTQSTNRALQTLCAITSLGAWIRNVHEVALGKRMGQLRIIVLIAAIAVIAWISFSTISVQGNWQGTLQRPNGNISFHFQIHNSRSGSAGWLAVGDEPSEPMDTLKVDGHAIRFDLTANQSTYHLQGSVRHHAFTGTWVDNHGDTGSWNAMHAARPH